MQQSIQNLFTIEKSTKMVILFMDYRKNIFFYKGHKGI